MKHTSPNFKFTVNHHTPEGQAKIAELRAQIRRKNAKTRNKKRVSLFGRGPRQEIAAQLGLEYNALYFRHPPLHLSTHVDVYVYPFPGRK